jgi:hypothetical protein
VRWQFFRKCGAERAHVIIVRVTSIRSSRLVNGDMSILDKFILSSSQLGVRMPPQLSGYPQSHLLRPLIIVHLLDPTHLQTLLSGPDKRPNQPVLFHSYHTDRSEMMTLLVTAARQRRLRIQGIAVSYTRDALKQYGQPPRSSDGKRRHSMLVPSAP